MKIPRKLDPDFGRYEYRRPVDAFTTAGIGITGGAAAGALLGTAVGTAKMLTDQVTIEHKGYEALRPVMTGAHYTPESQTTNYTYDDKGNISGFYNTYYDASWSANTENQRTGLFFNQPEFQHSQALGPLQCAGIGALTGGVVGGIAGALASLLTKQLTYAPFRDTESPLPSAGKGAAVGAVAGLALGALDQAHATAIDETVTRPTYTTEHIGTIPAISQYNALRPQMSGYDLNYDPKNPPFQGGYYVDRQVPTGQFEQAHVHQTSNTLTPLTGALAGTGVGFLTGLAIGVTRNTLSKVSTAPPN